MASYKPSCMANCPPVSHQLSTADVRNVDMSSAIPDALYRFSPAPALPSVARLQRPTHAAACRAKLLLQVKEGTWWMVLNLLCLINSAWLSVISGGAGGEGAAGGAGGGDIRLLTGGSTLTANWLSTFPGGL